MNKYIERTWHSRHELYDTIRQHTYTIGDQYSKFNTINNMVLSLVRANIIMSQPLVIRRKESMASYHYCCSFVQRFS